jgi:hypothetical protein
MLLTKGLYLDGEDGPFGLRVGQRISMRTGGFLSKCGWYNKRCQLIGFGDLDRTALLRIAAEIPEDELFLIVFGKEWLLHSRREVSLERNCKEVLPLKHEINFFVQCGRFIIGKDTFYIIHNYWDGPVATVQRIDFQVMTSAEAKAFLESRNNLLRKQHRIVNEHYSIDIES